MSNKTKKEISYKLLDATISFRDEQATCKLKIPSDDLTRYDSPSSDDRKTCLVVMDPGDIHCIQMMRDCAHKNILRALVVAEKNNFFEVWTESYTDSVLKYLKSSALGSLTTNAFHSGQIVMLPTANLQSLISQVFHGFGYLWAQGKYHGNFKLENTKFHQTSFGDRVVKLTCFKLKKDRATVRQCQAEDCQDVGAALKNLSETAVALNSNGYSFDCCIIDDLATRLQKLAWTDLEFIKQDILGHPFFWNYNEVKTFFVTEIPIQLNNFNFRNMVDACEELCNLPWNNNSFGGLLQVMNNYRARKKIRAYDFNSRVNYVQFLSGLYAHEKELQLTSRINNTVRAMSPPPYLTVQTDSTGSKARQTLGLFMETDKMALEAAKGRKMVMATTRTEVVLFVDVCCQE